MIRIHGQPLRIEDFETPLTRPVKVQISAAVRKRVAASHSVLTEKLRRGETVYGASTGFGAFSQEAIPEESRKELQLNLVRSHASGTGKPFDSGVTRTVMLLKLHNLCLGYSGVRWEVVRQLRDFLNHDILPVIPSRGSVGASGDLAPLAHMALVLLGEGEAIYRGERLPAGEAMKRAGIPTIELAAKE
ncbi:MAG: aromatic amino acid lyase, partial [Fidelibacterota bacterium]